MDDLTRHLPELTAEERAALSDGALYVKALSDLSAAQAEIERLRKLLDAAVRLHENRERIAWGVNPRGDGYGYYLGLKWVGTQMLNVIEAEAAKEE